MNGLLKSKTLTLFTLQFFLFSILPIPSAHAGEFRVFGPKSYIRDTSSPDTITDTFQVLNPNTAYTLRLTNGSLQDSTTEKVSSSIITLNGTEVVTPQDFNQNVSSLTVPVQLLSSNALSVELRSKPGGTLHGEIVGIDNELPVLQILTPQHGQVLDTDTMEVQIHLSDGISGINPQTFHITFNGVDKTSFFTLPSPTLSSSVTGTLTLPEGQNTLIASIQDQAGNAGQATVTFTVLLTPPVTPASGFIHGEVFDALSGAPLEGAVISVRGIQGIVRTGPDGRFSFPTPGTGEFLLMIEKENYTVAQRRVEVVSTRDVAVDPAFLTPLDPHTTSIGPLGGTATNSDGSVLLIIPQGALSEEVPIRLTVIRSSKGLPAPFPPGTGFAHALDIQPDGVLLNQPALLQIANAPGFAPGTPIPIALYNMGTLVWEDFGMAHVTPNGAFVEIPINHFSHFGCPPRVPPPPTARRPTHGPETTHSSAPIDKTVDAKDIGRGCPLPIGSQVGLRDGVLRVEHTLPSLRRLGRSNAPTFVYETETVKPISLIDTETFIDTTGVPGGEPGTLVPVTAGFKVLVEGKQEEVKFIGTQGRATQRFVWDGKNGRGEIVPSGSYPYTVELTHDYQANFFTSNGVGGEPIADTGVQAPELVSLTTEVRGRIPVENRRNSPFGAGWTLQGFERLHRDSDGALLYTDGTRKVIFEAGDLGIGSGVFLGMRFINRHPVGSLHLPPGGGEGGLIRSVAIRPSGEEIYAAESRRFHILDSETGLPLAELPIEGPSGEIAVSPDGLKAYVSVGISASGNSGIQVIDLQNRVVTGLVDLGVSVIEPSLAFTPDGTKLYITVPGNILVLDPQTDVITKTIQTPVGTSPSDIAVSPNGDIAYAGGLTGFFVVGVFVVDVQTDELIKIFHTSNLTQSGSRPQAIVFTPDGKKAYLSIAGTGNNLISILDAQSHTLIRNLFMSDIGAFTDMKVSSTHNILYGVHGFFERRTTLFDPTTDLVLGHFQNQGENDLAFGPSSFGDGRILYSGEFPGLLVFDPSIPEYRLRRFEGTISRFNPQGRLVSKEDRNGNVTSYTYTLNELLSTITGPGGDVTTFNYDANGRLSSVRDVAGGVTPFTIDSNNDLLAIIDPEGGRTEFTYGPDHLLASKKDPRNFATTYFYDSFGSIQQVIDPTLSEKFLDPTISDGIINTFPVGIGIPSNPAPIILPDVFFETFTDARGFTTQTKTDKFGAPLEVTDPLGRKTKIERNLSGLPTQITQPNGAVTTLFYDAFGNLTRAEKSHQDFLRNFTQTNFVYEGKFHQPIQITEGIVNPVFGEETSTTTIDYDTKGNPIRIRGGVIPIVGGGTSALTTTEMAYDARGLLTSVTAGKGTPEEATTTFAYDPVAGNLLTTTDPLSRMTTLTYDTAGNVTSTTDPKGNVTTFEYDSLNRLTALFDPLLGRTEYTYDANGNLVSLKDANFHATTFDYDALSRLTKTTNPLGQFKTFSYDSNGNLISTIDAKAQNTTFTYDAANQLKTKLSPTDLVEYDYDSLGNLTLIKDSDSKLTFTYDGLSRLIESKAGDPLNPAFLQPQTTIGYSYSSRGDRIKMTDPQGGMTDYGYDRLSRLTLMDTPDPNGFHLFEYDALSRRTRLRKFPGDIHTVSTYDSASQLLNLHHRQGFFGPPPFASFSYTYDLNGNRTTKTQDLTASTYTYDSLNRLTTATTPAESFTYDSVGNRNPLTQVYNTANRLLDDGTFTYTYDPNGNRLTKTEKTNPTNIETYTYDPENQLIGFSKPGVNATYAYDALGRRIQKSVNGTLTRYVYDNEDILEEYDSTNTLRARWTHGPGIDEPLVMERDVDLNGSLETQLFYLQDGLGSVAALVNSSGTFLERYEYDSFGNLTIKDPLNNILPQSAFGNPYTFTGREFDPESGLYYYRARYYDPRSGRFLQEDPVGRENGFNLYTYVFNNPTNSTDPLGTFPRFLNKDGWDAVKEGAKQILKARYGNNFTETGYEEVATDFANETSIPEAKGLDPEGVNEKDPKKRQEIAEKIQERLKNKYQKNPQKRLLLEKQRKLDAIIDGSCPLPAGE